jgi:hypothetical protein
MSRPPVPQVFLIRPRSISQFENNYFTEMCSGIIFKAHGLCVSFNSRRESNKEEEVPGGNVWVSIDNS